MENQNSIDVMAAWGWGRMIHTQMALRAAIELKVFDIIANSGPNAKLSSAQIVSKLTTSNPNASNTLDRILRMLGVSSILEMSSRQCENDKNKVETIYGLTKESRCLVTNAKGVSASPVVMFFSEKEIVESLYMLKDAVLKPEKLPVYNAYHGRSVFEDASNRPELNFVFNEMLAVAANGVIESVLETYKGFQNVTELMDVGGNIGRAIAMITSIYPNIRGINFDLPHVIDNALNIPGVKHIGGDMFKSLPKARTIFLKAVLHDWNDDQCIQILSNCWAALPDNGKVIVAEYLLPEVIENNPEAEFALTLDFGMLVLGGKERTFAEYEYLAKAGGFKNMKVFPIGGGFHILEFIKGGAE